MKALYKYPFDAFPYARLVEENARRTRAQPEFELKDTGVFDGCVALRAPTRARQRWRAQLALL